MLIALSSGAAFLASLYSQLHGSHGLLSVSRILPVATLGRRYFGALFRRQLNRRSILVHFSESGDRFRRVLASKEMIVRAAASVLAVVLAMCHSLQVGRQEVHPVVVNMVDENSSREGYSEHALSDKPVNILEAVFRQMDRWVAVEQTNRLSIPYAYSAQDFLARIVEVLDSHAPILQGSANA